MQMLDDRLMSELVAAQTELTRVERAEPPIEVAIVARLAEVEEAAARFSATSFVVDVNTSGATSRMVLGAFATYFPDAVREREEAHVRQVEERRQVLRMTPEAKATKLLALRATARKLEAKLELQRRAFEEDDPDTIFTRAGFDPSVWLADDADLQAVVKQR